MKIILSLVSFFLLSQTFAQSFYDLSIKHAEKGVIKMSDYKGKVVVVANVATRCGFTDQLGDLELIYAKYESRGLVVVGIPSNNFLSQTPEENKEVANFCKVKYKTNFPLSEKVDVIGSDKHAIIKWIQDQKGYGMPILWNFEKFIINREGKVVDRFRSKTRPTDKDFIEAIEKLL